jgi:H+-translocating NAD(P) transhydrogenase subunit alpha
MRVGIPREVHPGERRVAATPQTVLRLQKLGFEVLVEPGAGVLAGFDDAAYSEAGAVLAESAEAVWQRADVVLKVRPPEAVEGMARHEADLARAGLVLVCFVWPGQNKELVERLAARGATVLAMDSVPRITRAQKVDALSAMANIAGYRAVIEAANLFPRFFAGQTTAAGKVEPAKVLVIGAGVAGLAAIGAARGLGAIVRAFDTRAEVREQIQSMGAQFLEVSVKEEGAGGGGYAKVMSEAFIKAEMALFAQQAMEVDIIITTALIPGRKAPELITAGMVESMKEGSVIVDLAAEQGGNCTLTKPGKVVESYGVSIIGYTDLPSRMAIQSSQLYGTTLVNLLDEMGGGKGFKVDLENEIVRGALVAHEGKVTWPPPKAAPAAPVAVEAAAVPKAAPKPMAVRRGVPAFVWPILAGALLVLIGLLAPPSFLTHFTVFVLACFVGWQVVWNVSPALHTPLMSVTNAISGIILIGGMLQLTAQPGIATAILGLAAVFLATINIAGGFLVTRRMLAMFRR